MVDLKTPDQHQEEINTLVDMATSYLKELYVEKKHHVATVLQCGNTYYYALHLDTKGFDVCAEPIAISNALAKGENNFSKIVSVIKNKDDSISVISPCGNCRQILTEYCPTVQVVVPMPEGLRTTEASTLLPWPY